MKEYGIICVQGELQGSEICMERGDSIIVGRDSGTANLVFRDSTISRRHCRVAITQDGRYMVTDMSSFGIDVDQGRKMPSGVPTELPAGTILQIGAAGTKIQLK